MINNFAIIGVGGYIAPRHLKAIYDTGNRLVAAVDPHDSVGILDQYDMNVRYFTEIERFDRHLEKLRRGDPEKKVNFISITSPNYLHDAHCRLAMRVDADVICEKPLVINPWNLDPLAELEQETGRRIYNVLQLRLHPSLLNLKEKLSQEGGIRQHDVCLTYVTGRGAWYHVSWKGSEEKSGGIATNIGVHFFDMLMWLFGSAIDCRTFYSDSKRMSGVIHLESARVRWFLSVDVNDLPDFVDRQKKATYRSITVDGEEIEFSDGFTGLHTKIYEEVLSGRGFTIEDIRPSIELTYCLRTSPISPKGQLFHPFLLK
jgi:UDP-N-acetyl-2-amino-2-deoxyglucuronate dehydrogenase